MAVPAEQVVSDPAEQLILVDAQDNQLGVMSKAQCHAGNGVLHRAFSVHLIDPQGRLLLQQRSADKPLWPLYWSNSCCSHPRADEQMAQATERRLWQELGVRCQPSYLYKFQYQARYGEQGAEYELCSVYIGHFDGNLSINRTEVAATRLCTPAQLDALVADGNAGITPWFAMEWRYLRQHFAERLLPCG